LKEGPRKIEKFTSVISMIYQGMADELGTDLVESELGIGKLV
jgi:hypothetical protein